MKYGLRFGVMSTYDESLKVYWDNYSVLQTAKHEGREQGRQEGRQEGREEGIEEGLQKGRLQERIELAKRFKQKGVDTQIIAETTGLTREQIEKL